MSSVEVAEINQYPLKNSVKLTDLVLHSVEKCSKMRSRFLRKNQQFFRQINVFTKKKLQKSSFHGKFFSMIAFLVLFYNEHGRLIFCSFAFTIFCPISTFSPDRFHETFSVEKKTKSKWRLTWFRWNHNRWLSGSMKSLRCKTSTFLYSLHF